MFVKQEKSISEGHVTIYACASIAITFTQYTARTSRTKSVRHRLPRLHTQTQCTHKHLKRSHIVAQRLDMPFVRNEPSIKRNKTKIDCFDIFMGILEYR